MVGLPGSASAGLTVEEVIKMTNIGVSESVIVTAIEASGSTFELTPNDLQRLQEAGVGPSVIKAMQKTETPAAQTKPEGPTAPPVAPDVEGEPTPEPTPEMPSVEPTEPEESRPAGRPTVIDPNSVRPLPAALKEVEKKYKAGKFTSSAVEAYDLLIGENKDRYAEWRPEVLYLLGKSLLKLGYVHSAHDLMLQVAQEGAGSRNFSFAVTYLTLTSRKLRDYRGLKEIFKDLEPDDVPAKAENAYFYLRGLAKYENEDFADSLQYLARVSPRSEFYIKAHFLEGLIRYRQGDNTRASRIFREIIEADNVPGNPTDVRNLQDQALLNMARIYYRVEDFNRANQLYGLMPRDSAYWPRALFESAYASFWVQNYNQSLGQILTVYSPFFGDQIFLPDATILEALIYFNLCEYDRVIQLVDHFQDHWKPQRDQLRAFTQALAERPADAYRGLSDVVPGVATRLPMSVVQEISYDQELQNIRHHLRMIQNEVNLLAEENVRWRNSPLGKQLGQLLAQDAERLRADAGQRVLGETERLDRQLSNLIGESDIIEFEVLNAQKEDYEEKFQNPEFVETYEGLEYSYATEAKFIYWPFTGEFWKDELGYYRFTERGSCKN